MWTVPYWHGDVLQGRCGSGKEVNENLTFHIIVERDTNLIAITIYHKIKNYPRIYLDELSKLSGFVINLNTSKRISSFLIKHH